MNNKKLVVYTGSFNPITLAHIQVMKKSIELLGGCKGCFLPTCDDHIRRKMINKMERLSLSSDIRCKMINKICDKNANMFLSDYEIKIKNSSVTYKTFKHLKEEYNDCDIYYIMGADKLYNLPHFKNIESFLKEFYFLVFDRSDIDAEKVISENKLLNEYKDHFIICDEIDGLSDVSSSKVREMFLNNDKDYYKYLDSDVASILDEIDLNSYPEVSDYDYINLKLKSGPHGITSACRKVYLLNKELFQNSVKYVGSAVKIENNLEIDTHFKQSTTLCFEDCSYDEMIKKYDNSVVIVEANSRRTCGKYDQGGSDTLEEEFGRISNLSLALYAHGDNKLKCVRESNINVDNFYPLENNLYIKDVTLIRNGKENDYRLLDNFDNKVDLIMVPCLNLTKLDKVNDLALSFEGRLEKNALELLINRLRNAFIYSYNLGKETVIINAFGKGFHIDLLDIGYILNRVIFEFDGKFKNIVINIPMKGKTKHLCYYIMGEYVK